MFCVCGWGVVVGGAPEGVFTQGAKKARTATEYYHGFLKVL